MPRALWKGAIAFGLVHIPVELYPAQERKEFKFSMLDKRDFSPVGYKRYNKKTGKEVEWKDIVKGYEHEKDDYVVLSDEDFRRANVEATQTIDIATFVPMTEIPPQFYDAPYYLVPVAGGQKVYTLLRETLRSTGRVAVAEVVIRTTQHLAVVVPVGRALLLNTLRYADELRGVEGLALPDSGLKGARVTSKEVDLAKRLIDDMTGHWKPEDFKDSYHQDLMRRINEKIKSGETHVITEPDHEAAKEPRSAQVIDLASLLKQSLDRGARHKGSASSSAPATSAPAHKSAMARKPAQAKLHEAEAEPQSEKRPESEKKSESAKKPALRAVAGASAVRRSSAPRAAAAKRKRA